MGEKATGKNHLEAIHGWVGRYSAWPSAETVGGSWVGARRRLGHRKSVRRLDALCWYIAIHPRAATETTVAEGVKIMEPGTMALTASRSRCLFQRAPSPGPS